jgi:hypothetical protein
MLRGQESGRGRRQRRAESPDRQEGAGGRTERSAPSQGPELPQLGPEPADRWDLPEPCAKSDGSPEAPDGDVQEGTNHDRIQLGARDASQLLSSSGDAHGSLVGTRGGHHFVDVGDGHNPGRERNLVALELMGIPGSVEALVVLDNRFAPLAEPRQEWGYQPGTLLGMPVEHLPLLDVRRAGFIEQSDRHFEFADVVKQCRPAQPRLPCCINLQFVGDEVGEDSDAFGMTTGRLVVNTQCQHQLDDRLHALSVVQPSAGTRRKELGLQFARAPRLPRDGEPRRRLVRKQQCDVEQGREWEEAPGRALEHDQSQKRAESDDDDPEDCGEGSAGAGKEVAEDRRNQQRREDWPQEDRRLQSTAQCGTPAPLVTASFHCNTASSQVHLWLPLESRIAPTEWHSGCWPRAHGVSHTAVTIA